MEDTEHINEEHKKRPRKNPTPRKCFPQAVLLTEAEIKKEPLDYDESYSLPYNGPSSDKSSAALQLDTSREAKPSKRKKRKKGEKDDRDDSSKKDKKTKSHPRTRKRRKKEVCEVEVKEEPADDGYYGNEPVADAGATGLGQAEVKVTRRRSPRKGKAEKKGKEKKEENKSAKKKDKADKLSKKEKTEKKANKKLSKEEKAAKKASKSLSKEKKAAEKAAKNLSKEEKAAKKAPKSLSKEEKAAKKASKSLSKEEKAAGKASKSLSKEEKATEKAAKSLSKEEKAAEKAANKLSKEQRKKEKKDKKMESKKKGTSKIEKSVDSSRKCVKRKLAMTPDDSEPPSKKVILTGMRIDAKVGVMKEEVSAQQTEQTGVFSVHGKTEKLSEKSCGSVMSPPKIESKTIARQSGRRQSRRRTVSQSSASANADTLKESDNFSGRTRSSSKLSSKKSQTRSKEVKSSSVGEAISPTSKRTRSGRNKVTFTDSEKKPDDTLPDQVCPESDPLEESTTDVETTPTNMKDSPQSKAEKAGSNLESENPLCPFSPSTTSTTGIQGLEDIRLLTEQLGCLNRDSDHLNTVIHRKPTPRKRKRRSLEISKRCLQSTPVRAKNKTPHKSPWRALNMRKTPLRMTLVKTPGLSPLSNRSSAVKTPSTGSRDNPSPPRPRRTPSKATIKRRLYAGMVSPPEESTTPDKQGTTSSNAADYDTPNKTLVMAPEDIYSPSLGDRLNIASDDEWEDVTEQDSMDNKLEEKSQKIHLTAKNVRSIIHQVITNEHVLDMVRNTLQEDGLESQLKEAIFEPCMTRSKVKEAMEKGNVPLPWTLSPIKGLGKPAKSTPQQFMEMTFSDNEDQDDEYKPTPDELEHATDDEESVCSQLSEFGSPKPPNTLSLSSVASPCLSTISDKTDAPLTPSSMGPPSTVTLPARHRRNLTEALEKSKQTEEERTIALRTRSKLPLTDTPLEVLESNFVAPDITPDMYDTECDNDEWKEFLATLTTAAPSELNDTTEEGEDPEYNFLSEPENDDEEDFRNDKAVKIPKKELDELISELFEAYGGGLDGEGEEDTQESLPVVPKDPHGTPSDIPAPETPHAAGSDSGEDTEGKESYPVQVPPLNFDPQLASIVASDIMRIKKGESPEPTAGGAVSETPSQAADDSAPGSLTGLSIPQLTELERVQLQDQMRKHVQLLAQTFVQAAADDHLLLKETQHNTKLLLTELKCMGDKAKLTQSTTYLHPPNLEGALALTSCERLPDTDINTKQVLERHIRQNVMTKKAFHQYCLTYEQMEIFANSEVFLVPQMLPEYMLVGAPERKTRVAFTDAEDNLLAMGMEQFHHIEKKYIFIHKFLLPSKQREQIRFRHKNLKARTQNSNAVSFWYKEGKLPDFPRYTELEPESNIQAPKYRDRELLPSWFNAYIQTKKEIDEVKGTLMDPTLLGAPSTPTATPARSYTPTSDFKRRTSNSLYKKAAKPKRLDEDPQAIAPKLTMTPIPSPMGVLGQDLYISSPVEIQSCPSTPAVTSYTSNADMEQQVMDKLMSAIEMPLPVSSPAPVQDIPLLVDSVGMSSSTEGGQEPVVMLTASQLKHLGINIDLMSPVQPQTPTYQVTTAGDVTTVCEQSFDAGSMMTSPCTPSTHGGTSTTPTSGKKSLISHAFSEATGIPLDDLENMTDVSEALEQPQPPPIVVDIVDKDVMDTSEIEVPLLQTVEEDQGRTSTWPTTAENPTVSDIAEQQSPLQKEVSDAQQSPPQTFTEKLVREGLDSLIEAQMESPDTEVAAITEAASTSLEEVTEKPEEHPEESTPEPTEGHTEKSPVQSIETAVPEERPNTPPNFPEVYLQDVPQSPLSLTDESPTKSAIRVMAELAQLITPPEKLSPLKWPHQGRAGFKGWSPVKSPSKTKSPLRPLRPLGSVPSSPVKVELPKTSGRRSKNQSSPRRQTLNQHARAIAPKGLVLQTFVSPVKMAAASISAKARRKNVSKSGAVRKLRTLLPKEAKDSEEPEEMEENPLGPQKADSVAPTQAKEVIVECPEPSENQPNKAPATDEERIAALMAASTTVRGAQKKKPSSAGPKKGRAIQKREIMMEMLSADLVENDPKRDERDTMFAQAYVGRVRDALVESDKYEAFLKLLYDFGSSEQTPVELYRDITSLLEGHPDLVSDFAGFLLPDQAKVCGCLMENLGYQRAREFFRKLEVYFHRQPQHLQKIMKVFSQWQSKPDPTALLTTVKPLLKGQQHLIDEFGRFFEDERPPDSLRTDFEEITLGDSGDETFDGFEVIDFPDNEDDDDLYGTRLCPCPCHKKTLGNRDSRPPGNKKVIHCRECAVRVVKGQVYMQLNEKDYLLLPQPSSADGEGESGKAMDDKEARENIPPLSKSKSKNPKKSRKTDPNHKAIKKQSTKPSSNTDKPTAQNKLSIKVLGRSNLSRVQPRSSMSSARSRIIREDRGLTSVSPHVLAGEEALLSPEPLDGSASAPSQDIQVTGPTDFSGLRRAIQLPTSEPEVVASSSKVDKLSSIDGSSVPAVGDVSESDTEINDVSVSPVPPPSEDEQSGEEEEDEDSDTEEEEIQTVQWTRDEDRYILETCQREGTGTATFQQIASHFGNRTVTQVTRRFVEMMRLMTEDEDATEDSNHGDEE